MCARLRFVEVGTGIYSVPPTGYAGTERIIYNLSLGLLKIGVPVIIIDYPPKSKDQFIYTRSTVPIHYLSRNLRLVTKINPIIYHINAVIFGLCLAKDILCGRFKISEKDIVHVHKASHAIILKLCFLLRRSRPVIVYSEHEPHLANLKRLCFFKRLLIRTLVFLGSCFSDLVTFENPLAMKNSLQAKRIMSKCIVLLNCIDTTEFEDIEASTPDPYRVLMVGRICKTKGQLQLINAFHRIVKSYPQAKLTLVGGVEDKNYFRLINKTIARLRLSDNIQNYPHISHHVLLQRFYSKHGIHVVLSDTAGTDLVVPEILASGRVLLITDISSVREVVRHGKEAFLVNASDSEDIARGLLTLIQDNELREKLSQNARQHTREIFECRNIARHLLQRVQALLRS